MVRRSLIDGPGYRAPCERPSRGLPLVKKALERPIERLTPIEESSPFSNGLATEGPSG
jgi:hypothetical protein